MSPGIGAADVLRGVELGAIEASPGTVAVTTSIADVAGVSIAVTAGSRPFMLEAAAFAKIAFAAGATAGADVTLSIYIVDETDAIVAVGPWVTKLPSATSIQQVIRAERRITALAAGTQKTYRMRVRGVVFPTNAVLSLVGGTASTEAGTPPISLRATER